MVRLPPPAVEISDASGHQSSISPYRQGKTAVRLHDCPYVMGCWAQRHQHRAPIARLPIADVLDAIQGGFTGWCCRLGLLHPARRVILLAEATRRPQRKLAAQLSRTGATSTLWTTGRTHAGQHPWHAAKSVFGRNRHGLVRTLLQPRYRAAATKPAAEPSYFYENDRRPAVWGCPKLTASGAVRESPPFRHGGDMFRIRIFLFFFENQSAFPLISASTAGCRNVQNISGPPALLLSGIFAGRLHRLSHRTAFHATLYRRADTCGEIYFTGTLPWSTRAHRAPSDKLQAGFRAVGQRAVCPH